MGIGNVLTASLARYRSVTCAAPEFGVVLDVSVLRADVKWMDNASHEAI